MTTGTDISALYREFSGALTEVLAESAGSPVRRGRLARAHMAVKKHAQYNEHEYFFSGGSSDYAVGSVTKRQKLAWSYVHSDKLT